jgi:carbohydrate-selective porin OprB
MKFAVHAALGLSLALGAPAAFAAAPAATTTPAPAAKAPDAAHVKAVQDLMAAMQAEKLMRSVASRSRYGSEAQRKSVFEKIDKTPPAVIYQRLAAPVARLVSAETATEMTRFYGTPYGQKVIHQKYNSGPQLMMSGMQAQVSPEEKKERKRAAYVKASKELADAQSAIDSEVFKLLQAINKGK